MSDKPSFFCTKTLLSYHPGQDLNRITLVGPNFEFVLYKIGEPRSAYANDRCNQLAEALTSLWDNKKRCCDEL